MCFEHNWDHLILNNGAKIYEMTYTQCIYEFMAFGFDENKSFKDNIVFPD